MTGSRYHLNQKHRSYKTKSKKRSIFASTEMHWQYSPVYLQNCLSVPVLQDPMMIYRSMILTHRVMSSVYLHVARAIGSASDSLPIQNQTSWHGMHSRPFIQISKQNWIAFLKTIKLHLYVILLTSDFERYIDECIVPLNYHHCLCCAVQRPLEIYVKYLVWFFVLPIGHMNRLQINFFFQFKFVIRSELFNDFLLPARRIHNGFTFP